MIPRVVHFVFGLREQTEPFHVLHSVAIESALRFVAPDAIHFHYNELPWGPHFDRVRPHLTLHQVEPIAEVLEADYDPSLVPDRYRYAHHADFIRLDALIEHGGIYADIDTVFVAEFPDALFQAPFVIGREAPIHDERTGERRPSLCNALLMSEPGSHFATQWRDQMAASLNGTWSNHSGFLAQRLTLDLKKMVRVEEEETFCSFRSTPEGLAALLERETPLPAGALSIHLWAHLWWERERTDFSRVHAGRLTAPQLARARTTLGALVRPFLPATPAIRGELGRWRYVSLDEESGYGISADHCREALEGAGVDVEWLPFLASPGQPLGYEPGPTLGDAGPADVVVAHVVPEYLGALRDDHPSAFLVGHTVWETDRLPGHWPACLERADLILTQSRFSGEVLANSTTSPVAVVPFPAPEIGEGRSSAWDWVPPEVTVFYTIAEWNARKAVDRTVEAYLRAFDKDDPVLLIVKTSHRDHTAPPPTGTRRAEAGTTAWALAGVVAGRPQPPAIALETRRLSKADIDALHRRGDCFVSLARGEGWGMGAFAAASRGIPVVTTGFGGHLDFLGGSPSLIDYRSVPVEDRTGVTSYSSDQRWAEPDVDHAAQLLRSVITEPVHRAWAADRGRQIRLRYRPEVVAETFVNTVQTQRGRRDRGDGAPATTGVRWLSFGPGSGFGDAAETIMAGLREAGIAVTWSPLGWGENLWRAEYGPLVAPGATDSSHHDIVDLAMEHDTVVVHSSPVWNEWLENQAAHRRMVAVTTWESDRLPDGHVHALNRFDLVVVPSRFNVETFMASGVTVPVAAVPHIARPVTIDPPPPPVGRLRFYTIGTWTTRKALADTVAAFVDAFDRDADVSLLVCTTDEDHIALTRRARRGWAVDPAEGRSWFTLEGLVSGRGDHPPIELRTEPMTRVEVEEVHRRSHCFVSLSRGEGWGLGAFDAAAHGNPIVVTGWGGALDFLPEDYPYLVDYDLVASTDDEPDNWMPPSRGRWAKVRIAHASKLLRAVHERRDAAWSRAAAVAPDVRARFDSRTATARFLDVLARVPVRGSDPEQPSTNPPLDWENVQNPQLEL